MKLQLTTHLLNFIRKSGYRYFLSKTKVDAYGPGLIGITLTPISVKPSTRKLPPDFDTYFSINQEPVQMAKGVVDTLIFVKMDARMISDYIKQSIDEVMPDHYSED